MKNKTKQKSHSNSIPFLETHTKMKIPWRPFTTNIISSIVANATDWPLRTVDNIYLRQSTIIRWLCCKVQLVAVKRRKYRNTSWTKHVPKANTVTLLLHNHVGSYAISLFFFDFVFDSIGWFMNCTLFFTESPPRQMLNAFAMNVDGKLVRSLDIKWDPISKHIVVKTLAYYTVQRVFCWKNWFMQNRCTITRTSFWMRCTNVQKRWTFSWSSSINFWIQWNEWFSCRPPSIRRQYVRIRSNSNCTILSILNSFLLFILSDSFPTTSNCHVIIAIKNLSQRQLWISMQSEIMKSKNSIWINWKLRSNEPIQISAAIFHRCWMWLNQKCMTNNTSGRWDWSVCLNEWTAWNGQRKAKVGKNTIVDQSQLFWYFCRVLTKSWWCIVCSRNGNICECTHFWTNWPGSMLNYIYVFPPALQQSRDANSTNCFAFDSRTNTSTLCHAANISQHSKNHFGYKHCRELNHCSGC